MWAEINVCNCNKRWAINFSSLERGAAFIREKDSIAKTVNNIALLCSAEVL